jgi:hypothetical protein
VLTQLGLLAEFPIIADSENDDDDHFFGRSYPTFVRFDGSGYQSCPFKQIYLRWVGTIMMTCLYYEIILSPGMLTTSLWQYTTTLTPHLRSHGTFDITSHEIRLQCILCFVVQNDNRDWIKALWEALNAKRCYNLEQDMETGAHSCK